MNQMNAVGLTRRWALAIGTGWRPHRRGISPLVAVFLCLAACLACLTLAGTVEAAPPATNPMPASPEAAGAAAPPALRPYTAFSWSPAPPMRHVYPFDWANPAAPGLVARETVHMPDGCRVLFLNALVGDLLTQPDDRCRTEVGWPSKQFGVWPDRGVEVVSARVNAFFDALAKAGGKCDLVVLDFEGGYSNWQMNPARLAAIEGDPRFPELAKALGFSDAREVIDLRRTMESGHYLKWNAVMGQTVNGALDRAVGVPLARHFPAAGLSNYNSFAMDEKNVVPDLNGHLQYTLGKPVGTLQSPALYGAIGGIGNRVPADWKRPLTAVLYTTNLTRAAVRSSPMPLLPWVAFRSYAGDGPGKPVVPFANTDYWQESVYHGMLSGACSDVLFWDPVAPHAPGVLPPGSTTPRDVEAMEALLADLQRQAGGSPLAKPLTVEPMDYKADTMVSAARTASGKVVARVTFAEGVESAQVEIGGKTYAVKRPAGKVGAWVEVR